MTFGCPGEELPKVTYRLIGPEQYHGQRVLVVGGGDSAVEAAIQLADAAPSPIQTLLNIIPRNPVQAAVELNLLQVIFFTLVFGAALTLVPPAPRQTVLSFFEAVNEASMVVIRWVMKLA